MGKEEGSQIWPKYPDRQGWEAEARIYSFHAAFCIATWLIVVAPFR
jgi:hypothetical protein